MLKKTAPKYIDMATTLPLPDHPGGASNHMRVFLTDLPLKCNSSLDRLLVTNHVLRKQGADWSSFAFLDALKLLDKFPLTICRKIFSSMYKTGPSYTLSILPSTSSREFIDNGEIVDAYFVVGTTTTTGMNIGVWGINNQQRVNIYYTPNTFGSEIPNGSFSKYLAQELEMLDNLS
ncbi:unnamed protein product [Allacma fusca]|uniref:O-acyltransferase WSD1 C-terminal domain-containing protein n=1 Tax=Allacma fusca TaxID=39272 RepID=A0A8J2PRP5_9HEXA|nr:unnamed protein product [Allacma fusca]